MAMSADGPTEKVKSGGAGGGGGVIFPPPQPDLSVMMIAIPSTATAREAIRVILPPSRRRVLADFISVETPQQPPRSPPSAPQRVTSSTPARRAKDAAAIDKTGGGSGCASCPHPASTMTKSNISQTKIPKCDCIGSLQKTFTARLD